MRRVAVLGDYNARLGVSEGELRVTQSRLLFYAAISLLQEEGALPLPPLPPSLSPPQGAITAALNAFDPSPRPACPKYLEHSVVPDFNLAGRRKGAH